MTDVKQLITEHLDIWLAAETEKKSGRGRSSGSNDTIYGVQKLRELILELAFQGKLVAHSSTHTLTIVRANEILVPIPPLEEQQCIVKKVDELMQLCDQLEQQQTLSSDAHATLVDTLLKALTESNDADDFQTNWQGIVANFDLLFTTEYSIEQLKQTVLQLAVMGKLVKQDPSDEPASELLKKIAEEKAKLIKEGKVKKSKPLPEIYEDEKPFELQSGWEYTHLESQVLESGAGWSPSCYPHPRVDNAWGVLKVSAVSWDKFNPFENKSLPKHLEPRLECEVQDGDFLISRANTADLVAKSVIAYNPPKNLMLSDKIVRLKLTSHCSKEYINLCNKTKYTRNYYATVSGGTSDSMRNVSRQQILALVIPLPPINEQKRIVEKVNQLFSMIEQLQVLQSKLQKTKLHLADALVANALEGM